MSSDPSLVDLAAGRNIGALATLRRDGRPQMSMINITFDPAASLVRASVTDGRAKVANLRRDPRASLLVASREGWSYAVLEGHAELSAVARAEDDPTVEELVEVYRAVRGEDHPDWEDYRRAMVRDRRLVLRLHVTRVYGLVQ
jgi:PPOX class probable F420-dependent enzyme